WRKALLRAGAEVGRADPNTDPIGYRTLLAFQLAERYYREPGLAGQLLKSALERLVRHREADQVVLLQSGRLDYILNYENLAQGIVVSYVTLAPAIDL